jgi:thiol-disulfide isomerase/thioredoxin
MNPPFSRSDKAENCDLSCVHCTEVAKGATGDFTGSIGERRAVRPTWEGAGACLRPLPRRAYASTLAGTLLSDVAPPKESFLLRGQEMADTILPPIVQSLVRRGEFLQMMAERSEGQGAARSGQRGPSLLQLSLAICLVGCSRVALPEKDGEEAARTLASNVTAPKKVEFVVFSAKWCEPCRNVPPVLEKLRVKFPTVSFRDLDVDNEDNLKLWSEYGADAVPYYYVLADGRIVARFRGFLPYDNAEAFLRDALKNPHSPPAAVVTTTGNENKEAWTIDPALKNILGKHQDSKELQGFRAQMGEAPEVKKFDNYEISFQSWKSKGLSLSFNGKGMLTCIGLYSENSDDYQAYKGALPGNLSWSDTRADVQRKFGKPDSVTPGVGKSINLMDNYDTQGVTVDYHSQDPADMKTQIKLFRVFPSKAPK